MSRRAKPTHSRSPAGPAAAGTLTLAALTDLLRGEGLRLTTNRRNLLQALLDAEVPRSLEELQSAAAKYHPEGEAPDFATVFRMMSLLEDLKLARKVNLGRASSYYELTDGRHHHDHLVCTDCGQVTPLAGTCPVEKLESRIAREHGYTRVTHSLEFFGVCGPCSGTPS